MSLTRALLATALLLTACAGKSDSDGEEEDESDAGSWEGGPGDRVPIAGCTRTGEGDVGVDGTVDKEWFYEFSTYVDEDGDSPWVVYQYTDVDGDSYDDMRSYDEDGCFLYGEWHRVIDGAAVDERWTAACNDRGDRTLDVREELVDGDWVEFRRATSTYTYDDDDRIIEFVDEIEADGADPYRLRTTLDWVGEAYDRADVYVDQMTGDGEVLYYYVEYDVDGALQTEARIILGAYFGGDEGTLYRTTTWAYDGDGNPVEEVIVEEDGTTITEEWAWDEYGRMTMNAIDDPVEGVRQAWEAEWDPEWRRLVATSQIDEIDPEGTYDTTYGYDGGWPWTRTADRVYGPGGGEPYSTVEYYECGGADGGVDLATAAGPVGVSPATAGLAALPDGAPRVR
jgi:hypothetical protein